MTKVYILKVKLLKLRMLKVKTFKIENVLFKKKKTWHLTLGHEIGNPATTL